MWHSLVVVQWCCTKVLTEVNLSEVRLHLTSGNSSLGEQLSAPNQASVLCSRGRDAIAHACRARCPALVGSIFDECVIVINVPKMKVGAKCDKHCEWYTELCLSSVLAVSKLLLLPADGSRSRLFLSCLRLRKLF